MGGNMGSNQRYHRHSIKMKEYDYSRAGYYFSTICTANREQVLGKISGNRMILSDIGLIVKDHWQGISSRFAYIVLVDYVIMPDHIHGIIMLQEHETKKGLINQTPTKNSWILSENPKLTLGKIIRFFKAKTSKVLHERGHINFRWQRNYYEHMVRNDFELGKIREYIRSNVTQWPNDNGDFEDIVLKAD
jgi:putative transposase